MSASGSTGGIIEIPSIFVGAKTYANLTRLVENSGVSIGIGDGTTLALAKNQPKEDISSFGRLVPTILIRMDGEPPWEWYTPIFSLLLVLSLPSLLTLCTLLIHRYVESYPIIAITVPEIIVLIVGQVEGRKKRTRDESTGRHREGITDSSLDRTCLGKGFRTRKA